MQNKQSKPRRPFSALFAAIKQKISLLLPKTNLPENKIQNEERLSLALSASGAGIWSWDLEHDKIEWDERTYRLFGVSPSSFGRNYAAFEQLVHSDDRARVNQEIQQALANKEEFEVEFRVVHKDQSTHYLSGRGRVYRNPKGKPYFLIGVCWDMTQRRLAEEDVKHAKDLAEESSRLKSTFMAKISHDLRSPLNGIIGFAELMYHEKVGPISSDHKEYLGDILTSARHLLLLIDDVLDIAKVESGKMVFHPEKVDLTAILNEAHSIFQTLITNKNIKVTVEVDPAVREVVIDPARFKQVLYNYVSNALKCTNDNGHVTLRIRPEGKDRFCLEVEDTGVGIHKEDLHKLFTEFQQLDHSIAKKYPSTGLGLALTKHIVEAQGGKVGVKSDFGKGSTFFAILPRRFSPQQKEH